MGPPARCKPTANRSSSCNVIVVVDHPCLTLSFDYYIVFRVGSPLITSSFSNFRTHELVQEVKRREISPLRMPAAPTVLGMKRIWCQTDGREQQWKRVTWSFLEVEALRLALVAVAVATLCPDQPRALWTVSSQ